MHQTSPTLQVGLCLAMPGVTQHCPTPSSARDMWRRISGLAAAGAHEIVCNMMTGLDLPCMAI